jgi:2-keto-4-pentenoate hydratase/2-oxohepta-3-ene-1,7-dioic acid hydratase in catechol pathway/NADP-dependent 3-hydroxy acid dehydrogenase YdfG
MSRSAGRIGLVTGAGGPLGQALAAELARGLARRLLLIGRETNGLEVTHRLVQDAGAKAESLVAEQGDAQRLAAKVEAFSAVHGIPDFLVVADDEIDPGPFADCAPERCRALVETNILGPLFAIRAVLHLMLSSANGDIVLIGSVAGRSSHGLPSMYAASKWALTGLGQAMRTETAGTGVRVALIQPDLVGEAARAADPPRPLPVEAVVRTVVYVLEQPRDVSITEIVIRGNQVVTASPVVPGTASELKSVMHYAHVRDANSGKTILAALAGSGIVSLTGVLTDARTLDDLAAAGPDAWDIADSYVGAAHGAIAPVDWDTFAAPLLRPSKIIGVGLNYRDHALEQAVEPTTTPLLFSKLPSAIIGPGEAITWQRSLTQEVDLEVELAVVIGRTLRRAEISEARGAVFGYTVANDVTARDLQRTEGQWLRAKGMDTFLPLGPVVVTADEFDTSVGRRITSRINGRTMQESTTSSMVLDVPALLSYISTACTLYPGDLVLTGTPAGVGGFRKPPVFLQSGDVVEVEVDGIGVLRNPVC